MGDRLIEEIERAAVEENQETRVESSSYNKWYEYGNS